MASYPSSSSSSSSSSPPQTVDVPTSWEDLHQFLTQKLPQSAPEPAVLLAVTSLGATFYEDFSLFAQSTLSDVDTFNVGAPVKVVLRQLKQHPSAPAPGPSSFVDVIKYVDQKFNNMTIKEPNKSQSHAETYEKEKENSQQLEKVTFVLENESWKETWHAMVNRVKEREQKEKKELMRLEDVIQEEFPPRNEQVI